MPDDLVGKAPAVFLVLVGITIVVWSGAQLIATAQPGDTYRVEEPTGFDDRVCLSGPNSSFDAPRETDEQACYEYSTLTTAEQRVVRRGLNRSGVFDGPEATELQHFESGGDAPGPGYGTYYVHDDGQYYQVTVSSGQWENIDLLVLLPLFIAGLVSAVVGVIYLHHTFSVAGPASLLTGHAVLFTPLLSSELLGIEVRHGALSIALAPLVAVAVYMGFVLRRSDRRKAS